jgi:hypothetical protein
VPAICTVFARRINWFSSSAVDTSARISVRRWLGFKSGHGDWKSTGGTANHKSRKDVFILVVAVRVVNSVIKKIIPPVRTPRSSRIVQPRRQNFRYGESAVTMRAGEC